MKRFHRLLSRWPKVAWLVAGFAAPVLGSVTVDGLRCEHRTNPLGIDATHPRLSWILHSDVRGEEQTAYHILAASSPERLSPGKADLWDSGRVASRQFLQVAYQ